MNPKLRQMLIVSAKQAVNALMTNAAASQLWPHLFNVHTRAGWLAIGKLVVTVVGSREVMIWGPKILAWTQTQTNGNSADH